MISEVVASNIKIENQVLILAPTGSDARLISKSLQSLGVKTEILYSIEELAKKIRSGSAEAAVIAEEALTREGINILNLALRAQEPWSDLPIILLTSSGDTTLAILQITNAFSPAGNLTLLERPFRKITLQSVIQVARRSRRKQYQVRDLLADQIRATHLRNEFISVASHELRTPLTSLKLQIELYLRKLSAAKFEFTNEKLLSFFQSGARQVERLTNLVEDMLDASRIEAGKLLLRKEKIDLVKLVETTVNRFAPQLEAANCSLTVQFDESLEGEWDPFRIEQILDNLLSNVIRYCSGKPVEVLLRRQGKFARLEVHDNGPGIEKKDLERIFERFERADTSTNISGLGLGLFICKEIAKIHGGEMHAESEPGKGSSFIVDLPLS